MFIYRDEMYKKNYTKELLTRKKFQDWIKEVEHIYEFLIEYEDGKDQKIDYLDEKNHLFVKFPEFLTKQISKH